jgi:fatty-acyl-CoA synthase
VKRNLLLHRGLDEAAVAAGDSLVGFPALAKTLSITALAEGSMRYAGGLLADGVRPGDIVGIMSPTSPEFLLGFFGILRAGAVACPLPLPATLSARDAYAETITKIIQRVGITRVLIPGAASSAAQDCVLEPGVRFLSAEELADASALGSVGPEDSGRPALVQLSSGTISSPRGAMLTHAALSTCAGAISDAIAVSEADVHGLWIPLFHDMGLVATLTGLLYGVPQYLWPPTAFIRDPAGLLASFAAKRVSIHAGPNFAYEYMLASIDDECLAGLDLSSWRVAFNGAEPISPQTVQRFLRRFGPAGFRPEAMLPVYGLAEATLAVTFAPLGSAPVIEWVDSLALADERKVVHVQPDALRARGLVSVGRPLAGVCVRIVGEDGCPVGTGRVGEIQVQGPSLMVGYLGQPDATRLAFQEGWLRTGDLGFLSHGNLFIVGRLKEIIVVKGQNVHPETVEGAIWELPGIYMRRCAAFGISDGVAEVVAVMVEVNPRKHSAHDVRASVRKQLATAIGLGDVAVYAVTPGSIPRTTSGKLRRTQAKSLLLSGRLRVIDDTDGHVHHPRR